MTKHTILFLAANPVGTDRLALDEEARAIEEELERSGLRDQFELVTRWAGEAGTVVLLLAHRVCADGDGGGASAARTSNELSRW